MTRMRAVALCDVHDFSGVPFVIGELHPPHLNTNDSTGCHDNVGGGNLTRSRPSMKSYRQLVTTERRISQSALGMKPCR